MFGICQKVLLKKMQMNDNDDEERIHVLLSSTLLSVLYNRTSQYFSDFTQRITTLVVSVASFIMIARYFSNLMATDMVVYFTLNP